MEHQLNHEKKFNLIEFQSALTHYIYAIESLTKAVEKKEKLSPHPSLSFSKPILEQILEQTIQLKRRRLPFISSDSIATFEMTEYPSYDPKDYHNKLKNVPPLLQFENQSIKGPEKEEVQEKETEYNSTKSFVAPKVWKPSR